jgi:hypothetical protein
MKHRKKKNQTRRKILKAYRRVYAEHLIGEGLHTLDKQKHVCRILYNGKGSHAVRKRLLLVESRRVSAIIRRVGGHVICCSTVYLYYKTMRKDKRSTIQVRMPQLPHLHKNPLRSKFKQRKYELNTRGV